MLTPSATGSWRGRERDAGSDARLQGDADARAYEVACKPGMVGDGIRKPLEVTGKVVARSRTSSSRKASRATAATCSAGRGAAEETEKFTGALCAGDTEKAKQLCTEARQHYERIEPIAESFTDSYVKIDIREGGNPEGTAWTGFHRIEKELWKNDDVKAAARFADRLEADIAKLEKPPRPPRSRQSSSPMAPGS